jgi:hypothetical protein
MDPGLWFASESRARLTERRAILRFVPVTAPAIAHMRVSSYGDPCVVAPDRHIDDALGDVISHGLYGVQQQLADIGTAHHDADGATGLQTFTWVTGVCVGDLIAVFPEVEAMPAAARTRAHFGHEDLPDHD